MNKKVMIMFLIIAVGQMFSSISTLMLIMWAHRHENNHNSVIVESHNQK